MTMTLISRSLQCPRLTVHKHLVASLLLFYISLLVYLEPYITKRKLGPDYREYVSTLYEQGRRPWATSVSSSMPQHLIFLNDKFSPSKNQTVVLLMTECLPPLVVYRTSWREMKIFRIYFPKSIKRAHSGYWYQAKGIMSITTQ